MEPHRPTTWSYAAWWVGLMLLHTANVVYYVSFAMLYTSLISKTSNLAFQLLTYSIGISSTTYASIAAIHATVAAIHMCYILLMVGSSISARRLAFYPKISLRTILTNVVHTRRRQQTRRRVGPETQDHPSVREIVVRTASRTISSVFGRYGLLGVDGVYFDDLLVVREIVETSLQTYQAYRMTQLLPRLGLIRVYVALLVMNSWIVPGLHRLYKNQHYKRRLLSLLCDALLDTLASMGIAVVIFATYAPQYTDPMFGFPFTNWFIDEWFTSVYQEFQMMLVDSWGDMAMRLVFAMGLLQCMNAVKKILVPASTKPLGPQTASAVMPISNPNIGHHDTAGPIHSLTRPSRASARLHEAKRYLLHTAAPPVFVAWGFVILAVHLYAESRASNWPCKLRLRPWLTSKPACSLVDINCDTFGVTGSESSTGTAWTRFEPTLTAHVTIRHCPELMIPRALRQYSRLTSMKVYNSSISSWPETSAITSKAHGNLRALYFVRTSFANASLPPGLTSRDFPKTFRSFVASETNLNSLPPDLHLVWPSTMSVALEYAQFTAVPDVVPRLQPSLFSLCGNPISNVPATLFEIPTLQTLLLCNSKIQELPRDVDSPSRVMYLLLLSKTNVSTIWSWMDPIISHANGFSDQFFNLYDTPFCTERREIEAGTRRAFSAAEKNPLSALAAVMDVSTPERLAYSETVTGCDVEFGSFFPLPMEDDISAMRT